MKKHFESGSLCKDRYISFYVVRIYLHMSLLLNKKSDEA